MGESPGGALFEGAAWGCMAMAGLTSQVSSGAGAVSKVDGGTTAGALLWCPEAGRCLNVQL